MSSVCDISVKNKPLARLSERAPVRPTGVGKNSVDPPDARKLVRRHSEDLVVCWDNRETVAFMATVRT